MSDILITITLAIVTVGIIGFLGVHVTIHPVLSRRKRIGYQIVFCLLAVIAIGLISLQAYRNDQMRKDNQKLLINIQDVSTKINSTIKNLIGIIAEQGKEIAQISQKQFKINQEQLVLNYAPQVALFHNPEKRQMEIYNLGKTNIMLWGVKVVDRPKSIVKEPRIILPNTYYYILSDKLEKEFLEKFAPSGQSYVPYEIFVANEKSEKYIVKFLLWIVVVNDKITIHTQNMGITKEDWSK